MATVELTKENFDKIVQESEMLFIDFWAPWCGPCRMFGPIFEKVAAENPDIVFAKVNTEEQQELAGQFGIMSIPTMMIFRDQIMLAAQPGALPEQALKGVVEQVRGLDMDDIRRQVEEQKKKQGVA